MNGAIGVALAVAAGAAIALWFDRRSRALGLDPPGFRDPVRRAVGVSALALALAVVAFAPLSALGAEAVEPDFTKVPIWALFANHAILLFAGAVWLFAGFGAALRTWAGQVGLGGLGVRGVAGELGLGALAGIASWVVAIGAALCVAMIVTAAGGEELIPKKPPAAIGWIAGLPLLVRIAVAVSAGVFEELFFRGLLQPRIGIVASTVLFAVAHASYGQPFLLVGITVLSVVYGLLVRWRQSVWAAVAAHALFDLVQLLVIVPTVFEDLGGFFSGDPPAG